MVKITYLSPLVFFSDGAFEEDEGTGSIGGALLIPSLGLYRFFAASISREAMSALLRESQNPIAAIELAAVLIGFILWAADFSGQACIVFVDNDAAKHALVKGASANQAMTAICDTASMFEIEARSICYFERVPSSSNLADAPSRGVAPQQLRGWPSPARTLLVGNIPQEGDIGDALARAVRADRREDLRAVQAGAPDDLSSVSRVLRLLVRGCRDLTLA